MDEGTPRPAELERRLRARFADLGSAVVALSGGVDSCVVAVLAAQVLGGRALAVTGVSASSAAPEDAEAESLCRAHGIAHLRVPTHELGVEGYVRNAPDRCYFCKGELYGVLSRIARERGFAAVVDGTNADDVRGHRPGQRAAGEHGIVSPLLEVGASKADVRALARLLGLSLADKPSSPCLSSRIAYGVQVTPERLDRVGAAEALLRSLGFTDVRVRLHDTIARVEVPHAELARAVEHADLITRELRRLGFVYVTLDLAGLRSGSLLEAIVGQP